MCIRVGRGAPAAEAAEAVPRPTAAAAACISAAEPQTSTSELNAYSGFTPKQKRCISLDVTVGLSSMSKEKNCPKKYNSKF